MYVWLHIVLPIFLELSFLSAALVAVYKAQKNRIYPAFWQLLIFNAATQTVLLVDSSLNGFSLVSGVHAYYVLFYVYWVSFAVGGVMILRVLHEMFRHAVRSIPGVQKLGEPIFFWAITVSVILAFASSLSPHTTGDNVLETSALVMMRSQSVLALCMLTFLAFASNTLGVSFRSRIFGVTFGFGLMAVSDLVFTAVATQNVSLGSPVNILHSVAYMAAIGVWVGFFAQPEPARRLVTMPVTSPLMRWNDVAQTLGNPAGQVAVSYPPSFMTDVFDLVENVMGPNGRPQRVNTSTGPIAS
jgi:hypothetical protein